MELAIELLSTLESLEAKGMHKQADQLANVMIRMADEFSDLDTPVQQVANVATKTFSETESIFFNNYEKMTKGFTNQSKINMLENYLINYPEHSNYMKPVLENLLKDLSKERAYKSSFARSTNLKNALDKTGLLDSFKEINPSLNSAAELELLLAQKELANAQSADKSDDIQKALEKVQNATDKVNLEKPANALKKAEDALELAKTANKSDDEIKALEEAVKAAKGAAKPSNAAQLDDAVSLVTKISEKLPILKSILPSLGNVLKFAGIAGVVFGGVSALAGLNADFSKYSWEEIRSDSLLSMRFGHNLILLLTALGQVIPIPGLGLILGGLEFLINPLFESQYKAVSERQKKSLEENLTLARKHVENLISSDPKIKLLDIKDSVEKYYDWSTGSIIHKKAIEDFINIEVPKMLKDAKNKNESEKLWGNVPQMQPGTGMAGNFNKQTGKWEFEQLANNRENRIMVAALVDAARQYEREQRYAESDYTFNAARMAFG
jgi:hypothetical protein